MLRRRTLILEDGSRVVVAVYGANDAESTVVMVPGWKGTDLGLQALALQLTLSGLRVLILNFPGNGISPVSGAMDTSLSGLSSIVDRCMRQFPAGERCVLVGQSFGATIASAAIAKGNVTASGLVLVSPQVSPERCNSDASENFPKRSRTLVGRGLTWLPDRVSGTIGRSWIVDECSTALLSRHGPAGFRRIRRASMAEKGLMPDARTAGAHLRTAATHGCLEFAAQVRVPARIVAGQRDQFSTLPELRALTQAFPHGQLTIVEGAGHLAHHEDAGRVGQIVRERVLSLLSA